MVESTLAMLALTVKVAVLATTAVNAAVPAYRAAKRVHRVARGAAQMYTDLFAPRPPVQPWVWLDARDATIDELTVEARKT